MFSYKDKTFCPFYEECEEGTGCHRALTDEVASDAKRFGLPICQFLKKPCCYNLKKPVVFQMSGE